MLAEHLFDEGACRAVPVCGRGKEHESHREFARGTRESQRLDLATEQGEGDLRHDAGAITRAAIRVDGTAMGHPCEGVECLREQHVARPALHVGQQAHAAGVLHGLLVTTHVVILRARATHPLPPVHG